MKAIVKRRLFSGIFLCFTAVVLILFIYTVLWTGGSTVQGEQRFVTKAEVVEMTEGDTLAFSEIHSDYQSELAKDNGYRFAYQTARRLSDGKSLVKPEYAVDEVFVDEQGFIHATKAGVYQLEYAVVDIHSEKEGVLYTYSDTNTVIFSATVAVYAKEYEPFPTDIRQFCWNKNYKLDRDITFDAIDWCRNTGSFDGVIINPDGYTITLKMDYAYISQEIEATRIAFLDFNDGIIDGLNLCYQSTAESPFRSEVYAFCESNNGYIKNCKATGDIYIDGQKTSVYGPIEATRAFFTGLTTQTLVQGCSIDVSVYNDGSIYPYTPSDSLVQNELPPYVQGLKNNRVAIDTYYYTNLVGVSERDIVKTGLGAGEDYIYSDEYGNTFVPAYPHLGNKKAETIHLDVQATRNDVYGITVRKGGPIEIPPLVQEVIMGVNYSNDDPEIAFRKWVVNGKDELTLQGMKAEKNMQITAVAEYAESKVGKIMQTNSHGNVYYQMKEFYNADEVMVLGTSLLAQDEKEVNVYSSVLENFFANPYNRLPEKIILDAETKFTWEYGGLENPFCSDSIKALHSYLLEGGKLEVEAGSSEFSLIEEKMLCSADGKLLYYYFPEEGESSISLPASIEEVWWNAFLAGGAQYESIEFAGEKKIDVRALEPCTALKSVRFGEGIAISEWSSKTLSYERSLQEFLSVAPTLQSVAIDQNNPAFKAENGFVSEWKGYMHTTITSGDWVLVFVLPSMMGSITVPQGVTALDDNAFMGCPAEEIIFPDSLRYFKLSALSDMKKLTAIRFGASKTLKETSSGGATLPKLKTITFSEGTKELYFTSGAFYSNNLGTVVLPSTLEVCTGMFKSCEKFVYAGTGTEIRVDEAGALYYQERLRAFPSHSKITEYEVTGTEISESAFYRNTALKKVTLGNGVINIYQGAFQNTKVEEIVIKTAGYCSISKLAFKNCTELTKVVFEQTPFGLFVGESAFENCEKLGVFPVSLVTSMGASAFKNTALTSIVFHESLTAVTDSAFENCTKLQTVDWKNIQEIGQNAFKCCSMLQSAESETIERVDTGAFAGSGVERVCLPNLWSVPREAFLTCVNLTEITFGQTNLGSSVADSAFKGCVSLQTVEAEYLVFVGGNGFEGCKSLTQITLREYSAVGIVVWQNAFNGCTSLQSAVFLTAQGEEQSSVQIQEGAFKGCVSLQSVFIVSQKGWIATGAFAGVSSELELMIDGGEEWEISGSLQPNITIFVHEELVEYFREKWLVDDKQILPIPSGEGAE